MDIQLPGMNGIDALKALRADPATAAIPVVAITASVMQQDRQQIIERRLRRLHREAGQPEESPRHRAAGGAEGESMSAPPKILVVDDTPHEREAAARSADVKGYAVVTAANGEEALAQGARREARTSCCSTS